MLMASMIGSDFSQACEQGSVGTVHSVFERAVNIQLAGQSGGLLTLLGSNIDMMPACLLASSPSGTWGRLMKIGDSVLFTREVLYVKNVPIVNVINHARRWARLSDVEITALCKPDMGLVRRNCEFTLRYLGDKSPAPFQFPQGTFDPLDFIGLGLGLTPAGDDFLAGMLYGMTFMEKLTGIRNPCLPQMINTIATNLHRTGEISRHFLRYALAGEWGRNTEDFLVALTGSDIATLQRAIDKKLSVGASSGADEIYGCIFGVQK